MENERMTIVREDGDPGVMLISKKLSYPIYIPDFETDEAILAEIKKFPEEIQEHLLSNIAESKFWYNVAHTPTPRSQIEVRSFDGLEYVKEFYVVDEMNRLFPGNWNEGMDTWYVAECKTWVTKGYFCFEYLTKSGIKIRKIYSLGACEVQAKRTNNSLPSNPDDMAKGSLTEWYKIAGKRLGIARDIFSQEITYDLINDFFSIIEPIEKYAGELIEVVKTYTKGSSFRKLLRTMVTKEQINELNNLLNVKPINEEKLQEIWKMFLKFNNSSPEETLKITQFINNLKEKLCQS